MIEWVLVTTILLAVAWSALAGDRGLVSLMKQAWPIVADRVTNDGFITFDEEEK